MNDDATNVSKEKGAKAVSHLLLAAVNGLHGLQRRVDVVVPRVLLLLRTKSPGRE